MSVICTECSEPLPLGEGMVLGAGTRVRQAQSQAPVRTHQFQLGGGGPPPGARLGLGGRSVTLPDLLYAQIPEMRQPREAPAQPRARSPRPSWETQFHERESTAASVRSLESP